MALGCGAAQAPRNTEVPQRRMSVEVQARGRDNSSPDLFFASNTSGYRQWREEGKSEATGGFLGNMAGETGEASLEGPGMGNRGETSDKDDDDRTTPSVPHKSYEGVTNWSKVRAAGGKKRKGDNSLQPAKKNNPWSLEERLDLAKFIGVDEALMVDAEDGSRMVATKIGAVAGVMRQGNAVLEIIAGGMAARGAESGRGADDSHDMDPSTT
ncbi:hypothetical protein CBR_g46407 [Chara braunii]|uniref:Uncharacterized protein n=1 Tax=Chara braunii TaxID=69332 RepID=A0A388M0F7_CHABU|nr:hypothetical protein CBR_g46407 [Chara braunii]|eukprot:GBG88036.1 hypothetical protein CBR_g46407 [Chara braunii]